MHFVFVYKTRLFLNEQYGIIITISPLKHIADVIKEAHTLKERAATGNSSSSLCRRILYLIILNLVPQKME